MRVHPLGRGGEGQQFAHDRSALFDVETFEVRFMDSNGNGATTWPVGGVNSNNPPPAVEVTLAVKGVGSFKRLFLVNR